AARALLRFGRLEPHREVHDGGRLVSILGLRSLEILVLAGGLDDRPSLEAILRKFPVTPISLDALARFGDPTVWSFLLRALGDDDLAEDAALALTTLFGARVGFKERKNVAAWRSAIVAMRPERGVRYRRGVPFRPSILAA